MPRPRFTISAILLLILAGITVRFVYLRLVPPGFYYDEMDYVFTAESVSRSGRDLSGSWHPFSLLPLQAANLTAELPVVFHVPFQRLFGFGYSSGRLPNAVFGVFTAVLTMALVHSLFRRSALTLITGALVLTNPWHIHISRTAYEAPISLFFQVLLVFGLHKLMTKQTLPGLGLAILGIFFGYFTYHGAKLTVPVLVITGGLLTVWRLHFRGLLAVITPMVVVICLVGWTWKLSQAQVYAGRPSELINLQYLGHQVDTLRRQSADFPLKNLSINKFTLLSREVLDRWLFVFDPRRLLSQGVDHSFQFSLSVYPYFPLSFLPLFALGLYSTYRHYRHAFRFLGLFLVVSPVTSLFTIGYQALFRSGLAYIILIIFSAVGGYHLLTRRKWFAPVLLGFLTLELALFSLHYFSRYPVTAADNHHFYEYLLANYVSRLDAPAVVVTQTPYLTARTLVSVLGLMPHLPPATKASFTPAASTFTLSDRLVVTSDCPTYPPEVQIYDPDSWSQCQPAPTPTRMSLGSPIDSRAYYYLLGDPLCSATELPGFVHITHLTSFGLATLPASDFCTTWLQAN